MSRVAVDDVRDVAGEGGGSWKQKGLFSRSRLRIGRRDC